MTGRRVDRFREARGRPVAPAVVGRAEMRAALDHLAGNPDRRLARIVAVAFLGPARIVRRAAGLHDLVRMLGDVPVGRPLPDVADHVVEPIAVGGKRADRRRALVPVGREVLPGKLALPGVGHVAVAWEERVAPGVVRSFEATACGELPLGLGGQRLALPRGEGLGVAECDVDDRMLLEAVEAGGRTLRVSPVGGTQERPPVRHVPEIHRTGGLREDQRARIEHLGQRARILRGIGRLLREGHVTRRLDEPRESRVGDRIAIDPEPVDRDDGAPDAPPDSDDPSPCETSARNPHHVRARRLPLRRALRRPSSIRDRLPSFDSLSSRLPYDLGISFSTIYR